MLRGRFLLADASPVDDVISVDGLQIDDVEIEVIPLAGHSPNQLGFRIDGVFFSADIALPETVLEKYRIPYLYAVGDHSDVFGLARKLRVTGSDMTAFRMERSDSQASKLWESRAISNTA